MDDFIRLVFFNLFFLAAVIFVLRKVLKKSPQTKEVVKAGAGGLLKLGFGVLDSFLNGRKRKGR